MAGAVPGLVVLDFIKKKQTEKVKSNNSPLQPLPQALNLDSNTCISVLTSFSDGLECGSVSQINPPLSNLLLDMMFHHRNTITRTTHGLSLSDLAPLKSQ